MKRLILILALVLMGALLAGCSGFSPLFGYYGPRYDYLAKPGPTPAVTADKVMTGAPK